MASFQQKSASIASALVIVACDRIDADVPLNPVKKHHFDLVLPTGARHFGTELRGSHEDC